MGSGFTIFRVSECQESQIPDFTGPFRHEDLINGFQGGLGVHTPRWSDIRISWSFYSWNFSNSFCPKYLPSRFGHWNQWLYVLFGFLWSLQESMGPSHASWFFGRLSRLKMTSCEKSRGEIGGWYPFLLPIGLWLNFYIFRGTYYLHVYIMHNAYLGSWNFNFFLKFSPPKIGEVQPPTDSETLRTTSTPPSPTNASVCLGQRWSLWPSKSWVNKHLKVWKWMEMMVSEEF